VKSLVLALALAASCSPQSKFLERSVAAGGRTYRYRVWLPRGYTKLRRWPVILYLHGSGERGDDNVRQLAIALPPLLVRDPSRYRAIVVAPQCLLDHEWVGEMEEQALAALDQSVKEFRGDPRRVYLTGISMGGAGAWYFARHRGRFAAVVPICGEVTRQPDDPWPREPPRDVAAVLESADPFAALAARIGTTPVWAFHGDKDQVIPVEQSRKMVAALQAHHGNVRYTEFGGVGHNAWDKAYDDPALPVWLFQQRR
jgi:predicted peptidase